MTGKIVAVLVVIGSAWVTPIWAQPEPSTSVTSEYFTILPPVHDAAEIAQAGQNPAEVAAADAWPTSSSTPGETVATGAPATAQQVEGSAAEEMPTSDGAEQESDDGDIVQQLEEERRRIDEIEEGILNVVHRGHGDASIKVFGRLHLDYWAFPQAQASIFPLEGGNPQDRIAFRRMRIGVSGDIKDNMFYKIQMEFAGGVDPSYRDAYFGFSDLPLLNTLTIGNQKRPYGLDHLNSSRYNVFLERPFIIEAFNQDSRRLGISSSGYTDDYRFNWKYGLFNHQLTQEQSGFVGDHYQSEFAGRLATTAWYDETSGGRGYAHFAISGTIAFPDGLDPVNNQARYRTRPEARSSSRWLDTGRIAGADTVALMGLESVFNVGPLQIVSEYQFMDVERLGFFGNNVQLNGGYIYVSYFLTGEHIPWDRTDGTLGRVKPFENFWHVRTCDGETPAGLGAWQVAARLSWADLTDENIIGGEATALTLGLNWHWNPYARLQANYIIGDVDRFPLGGGDYQIAGVRFMVDF